MSDEDILGACAPEQECPPDEECEEAHLMSWVQLLSELDVLGLREHALCPAEAEISELFSVLGCDVVETMAAIVQRCTRVEVAEVEMDDNCGDQWIEEHDDFLLACEIQDRDEEESKERALRDLQFAQELAAQDREEENDAESLALAQQLSAQACEGHLMAAEDVKDDEKSVRAAAEMMRELAENDVMSAEDGLLRLAIELYLPDAEEKVSIALAEQLEHQFRQESLSQARADEIFAEREQARWALEDMESRRRSNRSPIEAAGSGGVFGSAGGWGEEPQQPDQTWDDMLLAIEVENEEKLQADRLYALRMQSQLESQQFSEEREEMEKREKDRLLAELWQREEERERAREWDERDAESVREIARLQREEGWIGSSSSSASFSASSSSVAADGAWAVSMGEGLFNQTLGLSGLEAVEAARRAEREKRLQEYDTSYRPRPKGSTNRNPTVTDVYINTRGWTVVPSPPTVSQPTPRHWPDPTAPTPLAARRPRPLSDAPLSSTSANASSSGGSAFHGHLHRSPPSSASSSSHHKGGGSVGTVVITGSASSNSLSSSGSGSGNSNDRGHMPMFVDTNPPRPVAAGKEQTYFDPFSVIERIDMRRLRALLADLNSFKQRREDEIGELKRRINEGEKNWDGMLKILQKCVLIERILLAYTEVLCGAEEDEDGCCRLEVTYIFKDHSKKGRLFAVAENVKLDGTLEGYDSDGGRKKGKIDKTTGLPLGSNRAATLQSMPKDLRSPLVGSFAYDVDCANSEVRILVSLAEKLQFLQFMPTLEDYFHNREGWLLLIMETFGLTREAAKRLPTIIISGGQYSTWEKNHATNPSKRHGVDTKAIKDIKDFAQKLPGELTKFVGLCRKLPQFAWLENEERKLKDDGDARNHEKLLLGRVVQSCEAEVLSIMHKKFHDEKWHVRAKVFDGLIAEPSDLVRKTAAEAGIPIDDMLRQVLQLAEESCSSFGWNVKLEVKPLFGLQDSPVDSIVQAKRALHL